MSPSVEKTRSFYRYLDFTGSVLCHFMNFDQALLTEQYQGPLKKELAPYRCNKEFPILIKICRIKWWVCTVSGMRGLEF